ncbi:LPS translocon maturation chaperone LptM [Dyella sp.]|uniref:LPS translocon maturation chaperone LptM n=1 Tax=Dyella sp. TaxID=1869338 RepID=UPI002ED0EC9A
MRQRILFCLLCLAPLALSGCGNKGPLFMPPPKPATTAVTPKPKPATPAPADSSAMPAPASTVR